jgi:3'-phosphoadenosine 5'-phosphosulfate sulfotransferase (PAPS reductase)/FAD synthetase
MISEGGRRFNSVCLAFSAGKLKLFNPMSPLTKEWEDWYIEYRHIKICDIYYDPFNFPRTGCKGCPFAIKLQEELDILEKYFPAERKQCELIWGPVYEEYRRIGYRLKPKSETNEEQIPGQMSVFDYEGIVK